MGRDRADDPSVTTRTRRRRRRRSRAPRPRGRRSTAITTLEPRLRSATARRRVGPVRRWSSTTACISSTRRTLASRRRSSCPCPRVMSRSPTRAVRRCWRRRSSRPSSRRSPPGPARCAVDEYRDQAAPTRTGGSCCSPTAPSGTTASASPQRVPPVCGWSQRSTDGYVGRATRTSTAGCSGRRRRRQRSRPPATSCSSPARARSRSRPAAVTADAASTLVDLRRRITASRTTSASRTAVRRVLARRHAPRARHRRGQGLSIVDTSTGRSRRPGAKPRHDSRTCRCRSAGRPTAATLVVVGDHDVEDPARVRRRHDRRASSIGPPASSSSSRSPDPDARARER